MDKSLQKLLLVLALLVFTLSSSLALSATRPSALSRWLALEAGPDLRRKLAAHPRYQDQRVRIVARSGDALAEAVAELLVSGVPELEGPGAGDGDHRRLPTGQPDSIDSLRCLAAVVDYQLEVWVTVFGSQAAVVLEMIEVTTGGAGERWRWRGVLSAAEKDSAAHRTAGSRPRGDIASPWGDEHITAAAATLSRELVCGLRPYTVDVTVLHWPPDTGLPPGSLADTVRASRHYTGAYRELDVVGPAGPGAARPASGWEIEVRTEPVGTGLWQLWLTAAPVGREGPGVQAVTYIMQPPGSASPASRPVQLPGRQAALTGGVTGSADRIISGGDDRAPWGSLQVELLGATRLERGARADLKLRLRLQNLAGRPLAFGLKSSAGIFQHCLGSSAYYRHQTWGSVSGVLQPAEIRIEELTVRDLRHRPAGVSGQKFCAGFGDLDKFSNYRRAGAEVTDYLRWALPRDRR